MAVEKKNTLQNHLLALKIGRTDLRERLPGHQPHDPGRATSRRSSSTARPRTTSRSSATARSTSSACTTRSTASSPSSRTPPRAAARPRWPTCWWASPATARPSSWSTSAASTASSWPSSGNRKYTFRFVGLDRIGSYGKITTIESQTYEDPAILAMNLHDDPAESRNWLARKFGFDDAQLEQMYENYRPLGACSGYIWNELREALRRRPRRSAGPHRDHPGAPDREPGHGHRQVPGQGQDHLQRRRPAGRGVDPAPAAHHRHQQPLPLRPAARRPGAGRRRRHPLLATRCSRTRRTWCRSTWA